MKHFTIDQFSASLEGLSDEEAAYAAAEYAIDAIARDEWAYDPQGAAEAHLEALAEAGAKFPMAEAVDEVNEQLLERFVDESDSRETSREILEAIAKRAVDYREAVRIWEDPASLNDSELIALWEAITGNGRITSGSLYWGGEGTHWAKGLGLD